MNTSDTEIVQSVLETAGFGRTDTMTDADVIFVNTCAIRENAEDKVWQRLDNFRVLKRRRKKFGGGPIVGVLGGRLPFVSVDPRSSTCGSSYDFRVYG
jgi:tRNA A37 methylthiotransferase MiaB